MNRGDSRQGRVLRGRVQNQDVAQGREKHRVDQGALHRPIQRVPLRETQLFPQSFAIFCDDRAVVEPMEQTEVMEQEAMDTSEVEEGTMDTEQDSNQSEYSNENDENFSPLTKDKRMRKYHRRMLEPFRTISMSHVDDVDMRRIVGYHEDYANDNYMYMVHVSKRFMSQPIAKANRKFSLRKRRMVIDWMINVCFNQNVCPEVYYTAVAILDRALVIYEEVDNKLILLFGAASLLLAVKIEDNRTFTPDYLAALCPRLLHATNVIRAERCVLLHLDFRVNIATCYWFLNFFNRYLRHSAKVGALSSYLLEASVYFINYSLHQPNHLAAAAIILARMTLMKADPAWPTTLSSFGIKFEEIKSSLKFMHDVFLNARNLDYRSVDSKYRRERNFQISRLCDAPSIEAIIAVENSLPRSA